MQVEIDPGQWLMIGGLTGIGFLIKMLLSSIRETNKSVRDLADRIIKIESDIEHIQKKKH